MLKCKKLARFGPGFSVGSNLILSGCSSTSGVRFVDLRGDIVTPIAEAELSETLCRVEFTCSYRLQELLFALLECQTDIRHLLLDDLAKEWC